MNKVFFCQASLAWYAVVDMRCVPLAVAIVMTGEGSAVAQQWTAVVLHPSTAQSSEVHAVFGPRQAGVVTLPSGDIQAVIWSGSASSYTSISPSGASVAILQGMDGQHQVGGVELPGLNAAMWAGSSANMVNLHPP